MSEKTQLLSNSFGGAVRNFSMREHSPLPEDQGKFGHAYLRFTILFAMMIVTIAFMPLWLSAAAPKVGPYIIAAITLLFGLEWIVIAICAVRNYSKLNFIPFDAWKKDRHLRIFKHIVIVPCYLDPLDVLQKCIASLATSRRAEDLVVVVTFEKKTPDLADKVQAVHRMFQQCFGDYLIVVHQLLPQVEIPGGCSNKNFAIREAYKYCSSHHKCWNTPTCRYTLTTCDTDSLFPPMYFEGLEAAYNAENPDMSAGVPVNCVWQPPLFYNWQLDERPFFNRVTCLMRSMMMLGGLISFNLNPMSIFSYPLELGYAAGFINPRYSVDDIIAKVRWMCDTNSSVPVKLLPVAVISGPTIGTSFWQELNEWGRQTRRWIVGSSESFHYFLIHFRCRPFLSGLQWFFMFFSYYGVLLCCAGFFNLLAAIPWPWVTYPVIDFGTIYHVNTDKYTGLPVVTGQTDVRFDLRWCGTISFVLQMIAFAIAFLIDARATPMLKVKESMNPLRNIFHWLTSPFVLLLYSAIALLSIVRFVFEGKKMAGHDMAAKEGFSMQLQHNKREEVVSKRSLDDEAQRLALNASITGSMQFDRIAPDRDEPAVPPAEAA